MHQDIEGPQGRLEVLEFDDSDNLHEVLMRPQSPLTISQLRLLKFHGGSSNAANAWKVMQTCAKSLECFVWNYVAPNGELRPVLTITDT